MESAFENLIRELKQIAKTQKLVLNKTSLKVLFTLYKGLNCKEAARELRLKSRYIANERSKLYKIIALFFGKEKVGFQVAKKLLNTWVREETIKNSIIKSRLTLKDISEMTKIPALEFINIILECLLRSKTLCHSETSLYSERIISEMNEGDRLFKSKKYEEALEKYFSATKKVFDYYPVNMSHRRVLLKAISTYNAMSAYYDVVELGVIALNHTELPEHIADIYNYMAGSWHEVYLKSNSREHLNNALNKYNEAKRILQNDSIILWNIFDIYIEAQNRVNPSVKYRVAMELAWRDFISCKENKDSNYKKYEKRILTDRDRIVKENQADEWLIQHLGLL